MSGARKLDDVITKARQAIVKKRRSLCPGQTRDCPKLGALGGPGSAGHRFALALHRIRTRTGIERRQDDGYR